MMRSQLLVRGWRLLGYSRVNTNLRFVDDHHVLGQLTPPVTSLSLAPTVGPSSFGTVSLKISGTKD
uniref:Uncharacterized protein n=1 Tax=Ficus carica TaxID=3494 RepID=A0AA88JBG1_FICCA|nr:hypothetical protein TIFTF001_035173 [Ficus carica]